MITIRKSLGGSRTRRKTSPETFMPTRSRIKRLTQIYIVRQYGQIYFYHPVCSHWQLLWVVFHRGFIKTHVLDLRLGKTCTVSQWDQSFGGQHATLQRAKQGAAIYFYSWCVEEQTAWDGVKHIISLEPIHCHKWCKSNPSSISLTLI